MKYIFVFEACLFTLVFCFCIALKDYLNFVNYQPPTVICTSIQYSSASSNSMETSNQEIANPEKTVQLFNDLRDIDENVVGSGCFITGLLYLSFYSTFFSLFLL